VEWSRYGTVLCLVHFNFDEVHFKVRVPAFALDLSDGQHLGPGGRNYPYMVVLPPAMKL